MMAAPKVARSSCDRDMASPLMLAINAHARASEAAIAVISLTFLTAWGQSGASGCRTINHWQLEARKPYGVRLFGVFALVLVGFKFPFGERRIGEFGGKDLLAWPQRGALDSLDQGVERFGIGGKLRPPPSLIGNAPQPAAICHDLAARPVAAPCHYQAKIRPEPAREPLPPPKVSVCAAR